MKGIRAEMQISGKSRLFVIDQELVTTHFPAVAYHVQEDTMCRKAVVTV
jgi:hypothetical protein